MFGKTLEHDIKGDTSGYTEKFFLGLINVSGVLLAGSLCAAVDQSACHLSHLLSIRSLCAKCLCL